MLQTRVSHYHDKLTTYYCNISQIWISKCRGTLFTITTIYTEHREFRNIIFSESPYSINKEVWQSFTIKRSILHQFLQNSRWLTMWRSNSHHSYHINLGYDFTFLFHKNPPPFLTLLKTLKILHPRQTWPFSIELLHMLIHFCFKKIWPGVPIRVTPV